MDSRITGWLPDLGVLVSVLTLAVTLLLMRALDDIRDLDYDRRVNPDRPLARGAVTVPDLRVLLIAGSVSVLALNAWRWPVLCVLAGQLGYAYLIVWLDRRFGWPSGDALIAGLLVNLPVQLLLNAYLCAGLWYSTGLRPSWSAVAAIGAATLVFHHVEFARKLTRTPRPGERTYVTVLGTGGTAAAAMGCALGGSALIVAATQPWTAVATVALLPLVFPISALVRFHRNRLPRWPFRPAALYLLTSFLGFVVVNLLERAGT